MPFKVRNDQYLRCLGKEFCNGRTGKMSASGNRYRYRSFTMFTIGNFYRDPGEPVSMSKGGMLLCIESFSTIKYAGFSEISGRSGFFNKINQRIVNFGF